MNVIDTHTHLPGQMLGGCPRPVAELRRDFERAGLVQAWIFTVDGLIKDACQSNDVLANAVAGDRDFFVPFCTVNPHDGEEAALQELDRARSQLGMRGLKLHPWLQAFSMTHPAIVPVFRRAAELHMPVILHDGTPPYCDPLQIAAVAEKTPETIVVLGHAGLDDLCEDAILACRRQPNIYLCLCGPSTGHLKEIVRRCPTERLLFGSDGGFAGDGVVWRLEKIRQAIRDDDVLEKVFLTNPRRIMES